MNHPGEMTVTVPKISYAPIDELSPKWILPGMVQNTLSTQHAEWGTENHRQGKVRQRVIKTLGEIAQWYSTCHHSHPSDHITFSLLRIFKLTLSIHWVGFTFWTLFQNRNVLFESSFTSPPQLQITHFNILLNFMTNILCHILSHISDDF